MADVVVWLDSVPPPLVIAQLTPALFLSLATVTVRVTESDPSTVEDEDVIEMLMGFELPPQPERVKAVHTNRASRAIFFDTCILAGVLNSTSWDMKPV